LSLVYSRFGSLRSISNVQPRVYQKYGAIFAYFDSLIVGLTATPKKDIDRNTYELLDIEDDNPTFAYELDQAVQDGFLVPPKGISVPVKFIREGIKYSELTEREKEEYEEKFGDPTTGELPDEIGSEALNKWLFNADTVDKVLLHLMDKGIKVQGGDKLGKTIIFAKNHEHAVFIEKRFNKLFPEHRGKFLRVIDNYESKAQDLLERFANQHVEMNPQIAVSVDMLDTGIDAPRVVNLVFFKMVRSQVKFWQMLGRGTRLCPNLFGPGEDKSHFLIFDYCQNLEFFEANPDGTEGKPIKSLTQRIFEMKLDVVMAIRETEASSDGDNELAGDYAGQLHRQVHDLNRERFVVKMKLRWVLEYSSGDRWENLSRGDVADIRTNLAPLVLPAENEHELARRFDIMMLSLKLALLSGRDIGGFVNKVGSTARELEKKKNIPVVGARIGIIREVQTERFWQTVNVKRLEEVRVALRDLIEYLDARNKVTVYSNFEDTIGTSEESDISPVIWSTRLQSYKDRVESYIRKNKHHITIRKLSSNEPITAAELEELGAYSF
jgi:type I restriction enzyme, R subunit